MSTGRTYEKTCDSKLGNHQRICQAIKHADLLTEKVTLTFDPVATYWCDRHQVYHVGHDKYMNRESVKVYESAARDRGNARIKRGEQSDIVPTESYLPIKEYRRKKNYKKENRIVGLWEMDLDLIQ